jgi:hypothetical protein
MQVFGYHSRIRKINPVCPQAAPVSTVSTTRFNKDQLVGVFHVEKRLPSIKGVYHQGKITMEHEISMLPYSLTMENHQVYS